MANAYVSAATGLLTFGVGLLGLFLQRLLPERHMSAGSRDMIGAVMGLLSRHCHINRSYCSLLGDSRHSDSINSIP